MDGALEEAFCVLRYANGGHLPLIYPVMKGSLK